MTDLRELKIHKAKLLEERRRRLSLPINMYTPDSTPDRNQLAFHSSPARYRLGFGGNRAGKSVMTAYEAAATARGCHRFLDLPPGPKEIYVVSAEYRTLYQGIYRHIRPDGTGKAMKFLDPTWVKGSAAKVPGATVPLPGYIQVWSETHDDGSPVHPDEKERPYSTIWFISGDGGEQARKKAQAAAVDLVIIDEEIDELMFKELQMRILDSGGKICVSATLVRSEDWLMELEDRATEGDEAVSLIRLNTESSKHLDESAKKEILATLSDEERAVRVEGKSRRQFGLVYPDFTMDHTFDPEKFKDGLPDGWPIIFSNDPGFKVHAGLWAVVDSVNATVYFYREMYSREASLHDTCELIANVEGYNLNPSGASEQKIFYSREAKHEIPEHLLEKPLIRLMDPAGLRFLEDGSISIGMQMAAYFDTPVAPANNNMYTGIESVKKLLSINPNTGKPHALFSTDLKHFFSERRKYRFRGDTSSRNAHATKAEPLRKNNHLMDTLRYISSYILMMWGETSSHRHQNQFNHSLNIGAANSMSDRMLAHAQALRERNTEHAAGLFVGSEW